MENTLDVLGLAFSGGGFGEVGEVGEPDYSGDCCGCFLD